MVGPVDAPQSAHPGAHPAPVVPGAVAVPMTRRTAAVPVPGGSYADDVGEGA